MRPTSSTRPIYLLSFCVAGLVALSGCLPVMVGPDIVYHGYPCGFALDNRSLKNLESACLTFESGETYDFGQISWCRGAFRFIEMEGRKEATLDLRWKDGQVEQKLLVFDVPACAAVMIDLWPRRPQDTHKYSAYSLREPAPGNAQGPQDFAIGNDTPQPIHAEVSLRGTWGATELPPYSVASWGHWDPGLLGKQQARVRLTYADGAEFEATASIDVKPMQRLIFIIKEEGKVIVWDDPTVDETSVVETVEIASQDRHSAQQ